MANEEQLKRALIQADAAGDTEAAQLFANKINELRASGSGVKALGQPASPTPPPSMRADESKWTARMNASQGPSYPMAQQPQGALGQLITGPAPSKAQTNQRAEDIARRAGEETNPTPTLNETATAAGRTLKSATKGILAIPALAGDVLSQLVDNVIQISGFDYSVGRTSTELNRLLDQAGFPEDDPSTSGQVADALAQSIGATGGIMKLGQKLVQSQSPRIAKIGEFLIAHPKAQGAGAVTAPLASEAAEGMGAGTVGQFAAGLAGGMAPGMAGASIRSRATKGLVEEGLPSAQEAKALEEAMGDITRASGVEQRTGVGLARFQKTQNPVERTDYQLAKREAGGARTARAFEETQSEELKQFRDKTLSSIAGDDSINVAGGRIRSTANKMVEDLELARKEASDKFYNEAKQINPDIDVEPVRGVIRVLKGKFPKGNKLNRYLSNTMSMLDGESSANAESLNKLDALHNTRMQIDDWLKHDATTKPFNEGQINALNTIRAQINKAIESSGEAGLLFRKGDAAYSAATPAVDNMRKSMIGKFANRDDTTLDLMIDEMFNARRINPTQAAKNRADLMKADKQGYREMYRANIERKLASKNVDSRETPGNLPSKWLTALFGNDREFKLLMASAPDAPTRQRMKDFKESLELANIGRQEGSPTQPLSSREKHYRSKGVSGFIRKIISPQDSAIKGLEGVDYEARMNGLARMLTETRWEPDWQKIRAAGIGTPKGQSMLETLFTDILRAGALTEGEDQPDPPQTQAARKTFNVK
jgi:hypothetical protein